MRFYKISSDKKRHLDLLLVGDEQEDMIDRYLERGEMWVLDDGGVKAVCVLTDEGDGILEIKNLAVASGFQRQGYGRMMIDFVAKQYGNYPILRVGTGESPLTMPFYHSCGFKDVGRIKNFFVDNYDHPVIEAGVILEDMVILERRNNEFK